MVPAFPKPLFDDLAAAGLEWPWHESADSAIDDPGAYILLVGLRKRMKLKRPAGAGLLQPGWYLYAGSARGPGGIRARLARHFKKSKGGHWHIDQLTRPGNSLAAHDIAGADECDLVAALSAFYAFDAIKPGFGSTDCRVCPSHLLVWRPPESRPR